MRIEQGGRTYLVEAAHPGWKLATIKTITKEDSENFGKESETNVTWPGTYPQALRALLERMVSDGLEPDQTLAEAVASVAHMYATIGEHC